MPAERTPPDKASNEADPSVLARPLVQLTSWVLRFPVPVLAMAVAAGVVCIVLAIGSLGFHTSRVDLISRDNAYNKLYLQFTEEFHEQSEVVIVVEGDSRGEVVPVLQRLSESLAQHDRLFCAVLHELDFSRIRAKGLHYASPRELAELEGFIARTEPITSGDWERLAIDRMLGEICSRLEYYRSNPNSPEYRATVAELDRHSRSLCEAFGPNGTYDSPWPTASMPAGPDMPGLVATVSDLDSSYLLTNHGRTGFVFLQLAAPDTSQFAQGTEAIDTLRRLIAEARTQNPHVSIGLTGLPIMENDEMRISQSAMTKASVLSLVGVACLFIAGLGGLRHPMMTVGALLIALAWSFGYITLAVGHLNILSISFGVILIGLGIDFGIHYIARYLQLRGQVRGCHESILRTAGSVGPGILTGAVTTAIAFFTAGLTEFTGVAELGVIAGGGILLCCLAALVLLPAMLSLSDSQRVMRVLPTPLDIHGGIKPIFTRPLWTFGFALVLTLILMTGIPRVWYDHNLLNLQPENLESVALERKLLDEYAQSVTYAVSISDNREELLQRAKEFADLETVASVTEIASAIPCGEENKSPAIARIAKRLEGLPELVGPIRPLTPEQLANRLAAAHQLLLDDPKATQTRLQLNEARERIRRLPPNECARRLESYQAQIAGDLLSNLHAIRAVANPEPPKWSDLPEGLVARFLGRRDDSIVYLLKIHPKDNIWEMDKLETFVADIRTVDPRVTGSPIQTYEASKSMKKSYEAAALYAFIAIVVVLMIDFRSVTYTLLAMVPLGLGVLQMFGLLGLLGIPLNPANMIVLPLILGIGIDDGVHVVHDFRNQKGRYHMSPSTASAVLITSLTTMVGFGSLMIASHRGLQSLGRVLTIGVSCCLFASLIMLPALLTWMSRFRAGAEDEAAEEDASTRRGRGHRRDWRRLHSSHGPIAPSARTDPRESEAGVHREDAS